METAPGDFVRPKAINNPQLAINNFQHPSSRNLCPSVDLPAIAPGICIILRQYQYARPQKDRFLKIMGDKKNGHAQFFPQLKQE